MKNAAKSLNDLVADFCIGVRAKATLKEAGIVTIKDLLDCDTNDLFRYSNFDKKSMQEITNELKSEYGIDYNHTAPKRNFKIKDKTIVVEIDGLWAILVALSIREGVYGDGSLRNILSEKGKEYVMSIAQKITDEVSTNFDEIIAPHKVVEKKTRNRTTQ